MSDHLSSNQKLILDRLRSPQPIIREERYQAAAEIERLNAARERDVSEQRREIARLRAAIKDISTDEFTADFVEGEEDKGAWENDYWRVVNIARKAAGAADETTGGDASMNPTVGAGGVLTSRGSHPVKTRVVDVLNEMREIAEDMYASNVTTEEEDRALDAIFDAVEQRAAVNGTEVRK